MQLIVAVFLLECFRKILNYYKKPLTENDTVLHHVKKTVLHQMKKVSIIQSASKTSPGTEGVVH